MDGGCRNGLGSWQITCHKQSSLWILGKSPVRVFLEGFQRDLRLTGDAASDVADSGADLVVEPFLGKLMGRDTSEELALE